MSYNYLKGVKMSKLLINKLVLPVVLLVLSIGTASAALQCGAQPSCADLGYSKTHISGCTDYIYCPFDTSYKKCVTARTANNRCNSFTLNDCPANANCDYCATAYKIVGCDDGYTLKNNSCVCATSCTNKINQSDIPTNASAITESCTACDVSANIITGWKCDTGYTKVGNLCELTYANCEQAGYRSSKVTNASCQSPTIYLTDGTQKTCYDKCECPSGYNIEGDRCVNVCQENGYFHCIPKFAASCDPVPTSLNEFSMRCYTNCRLSNGTLMSNELYTCK